MIEEKYEILDKKFNELFARTANLIKLESKNKRSKKDLERSIKFLRAQYKGTFTQSRNRRCFYGTPRIKENNLRSTQVRYNRLMVSQQE